MAGDENLLEEEIEDVANTRANKLCEMKALKNPLARQVPTIPGDVASRAERGRFPWPRIPNKLIPRSC
jgi:hypothetical protein